MSEQLSNCKNRRIFFILNPIIPKEIFGQITGICKEQIDGVIAAKLVDFDKLGIWVENKQVLIENLETKKTNKYDCNVLIKWEYIVSIVRMPEREAPIIKNEVGFK